MTAASKALLMLAALLIVATGVLLFVQSSDAPVMPPATIDTPEAPRTAPAEEPTQITPVREPEASSRTTAREVLRGTGGNEAQGFRAIVLDPLKTPVEGADVYLMPGTGANILQTMQLLQSGASLPPLAKAQTDRNGAFALGLAHFEEGKSYELRVVTTRFAEHRLPNLRLHAEEWYDLGTIDLSRGAIVSGRVTIAGSSGMPVAGARVSFRNAQGFPDLTPTPGREMGLTVEADANGNYRCESVPAGSMHVSAVAPGYARFEQQNVQVHADQPTELHFELSPGLSIAGIVIDGSGVPVPEVKLNATAISSKTPGIAEARSGPDGRFEILGLLEGPYIVNAVAPSHVKSEVKPVHAGETELRVVLERQGSARIQVWGKDGRLLTAYTLTLKRYMAGQEHFGNLLRDPIPAKPDRDGVTTVEGLDAESYVFQVEAPQHAMAFSDPFQVVLGGDPPTVIVRLDEGGILEGIVTDVGGQPLAGVAVSTMPNDYDENPFTVMFGAMMPVKVTRKTLQTDARGYYRFNLLNPGMYQLKFAHAQYIETFLKHQVVQTGQTTTVPSVTMTPGTVLTGQVLVDGKPGGQVKVNVSAVVEPNPAGQPAPSFGFSCEAFTDPEGKFLMPKRLPPGRYQVTAMRQALENPLFGIVDVMKTKQEFLVGSQTTQNVTIQITSQ